MWLFTRYGFFSIACARKDDGRSRQVDPDTLMIRARQRRHIENLKERFPDLAGFEVQANAGTDYRYRIVVPKSLWANVVSELVDEQTWSNFKGEAAQHLGPDYQDYEQALHQVWSVTYRLQANEPKAAASQRGRYHGSARRVDE